MLFMALGVNVIVNVVLCTCIYFILLKILKEPLLKEVVAIVPIGKKALS